MVGNNSTRVTVLGVGNMGEALVRGLLRGRSGKRGFQVVACDVSADKLRALQGELLGLHVERDAPTAIRTAEIIVLATKPGDLPQLLKLLRPELERRKEQVLLISVAAGLRIEELRQCAGEGARIVRGMPNLPATIGAGMTAVYASTEDDWEIARDVLESIGDVQRLTTEAQIDVATALSAGGPAFACLVVEALADGGVKCGLPRDVAQRLAVGMLSGTAKYLEKTGLHPAVIRERVCSPGGTTIAGIAVLERAAVRAAFISAIDAATERAQVLGKGSREPAASAGAVPAPTETSTGAAAGSAAAGKKDRPEKV